MAVLKSSLATFIPTGRLVLTTLLLLVRTGLNLAPPLHSACDHR